MTMDDENNENNQGDRTIRGITKTRGRGDGTSRQITTDTTKTTPVDIDL